MRFSEPAYVDHADGSPLELLTWDGQGRLTDRTTASDQYRYAYDGAGRLDSAEVNGGHHYYGYNVDDELIFEDHKSYRVYRFGSYRYASNDKRVIVKPLPQIALVTESGKTKSRWMFLEPDGHTLESAGEIPGQAGEMSFDILGAYGRTLASSGDVLPIDGFHGADADPGVGVVPFGVRHVVKDVGMWMQPEPLLYLGLTAQRIDEPRSTSGAYAGGNPVNAVDTSGYDPESMQTAGWRHDRGDNNTGEPGFVFGSTDGQSVSAGIGVVRTTPADGDAQLGFVAATGWAGAPTSGDGAGRIGAGAKATAFEFDAHSEDGVGLNFTAGSYSAEYSAGADGVTLSSGAKVGAGVSVGARNSHSSSDVVVGIGINAFPATGVSSFTSDIDGDGVTEFNGDFQVSIITFSFSVE